MNLFRRQGNNTYRLVSKNEELESSDSEKEEFSQIKSKFKFKQPHCSNIPRCKRPAIFASIILFIIGAVATYYILKREARGSDCPAGCHCGYLHSPLLPQYGVGCDGLELTSIPDNLPIQTTDLALGNNRLTSIKVSALEHLPHLRLIYLGNNKLTRVSNATLQFFISLGIHLTALDLSGNPWDCSCNPDTEQFIKWLENNRGPTPIIAKKHWVALIDGYNTLCDTPPNMKGKRIDHLKHSEIC